METTSAASKNVKLFYLARVWTYLYFVPQIFRFSAIPAGASLSSDLTASVMKWVNLSWIRCAIDGVVALLFLTAAFEPDEID